MERDRASAFSPSGQRASCPAADLYNGYADLAASETEGVHYRIRTVERASAVAIIAPHGGRIEPFTSEMVLSIAGCDFSLYCFEGLVSGRRLHITSSRFDEPRGLALASASEIVIAVHGRADAGDPHTVWMGGLHLELRDAIGASLGRAGFGISTDHHMQGKHPGNICNRGRLSAGVQIELPRSLRRSLRADPDLRRTFVAAVRDPIIERAPRG
ncbi:MAG TPA: poly-gamma-glutamate hydrolase family protein [Methylocystis sp.]|nr:poly-gamma-glutamate hydrolase family protein [Methylocystis sp.]